MTDLEQVYQAAITRATERFNWVGNQQERCLLGLGSALLEAEAGVVNEDLIHHRFNQEEALCKAMGEVFVEAGNVLPHWRYLELKASLCESGKRSQMDIEAAILVARGKLDARLVVGRCVPVDLLILPGLTPKHQARLLNEELPLLQRDGSVVRKRLPQMSWDEVIQLLGGLPDGNLGMIHSPECQCVGEE